MSLMLTRLLPPIEVMVTDYQGPELKVRFGPDTPLLRDVMAEAEDYLKSGRPFANNDPRLTFLEYVMDLRREQGFDRYKNRLASVMSLRWRALDEEGVPMRFCGQRLMPKDVLDALAYILTSADLVPRDPRESFLARLHQLHLI